MPFSLVIKEEVSEVTCIQLSGFCGYDLQRHEPHESGATRRLSQHATKGRQDASFVSFHEN